MSIEKWPASPVEDAEREGEEVISNINKEKAKKAFVANEIINGVEVGVKWSERSNCYMMSVSHSEFEIAHTPENAETVLECTRFLGKMGCHIDSDSVWGIIKFLRSHQKE